MGPIGTEAKQARRTKAEGKVIGWLGWTKPVLVDSESLVEYDMISILLQDVLSMVAVLDFRMRCLFLLDVCGPASLSTKKIVTPACVVHRESGEMLSL